MPPSLDDLRKMFDADGAEAAGDPPPCQPVAEATPDPQEDLADGPAWQGNAGSDGWYLLTTFNTERTGNLVVRTFPPDVAKPNTAYTVIENGRDARLKFGKHRGKSVSAMSRTSDGAKYLDWMLRPPDKGMARELLAIIRAYRAPMGSPLKVCTRSGAPPPASPLAGRFKVEPITVHHVAARRAAHLVKKENIRGIGEAENVDGRKVLAVWTDFSLVELPLEVFDGADPIGGAALISNIADVMKRIDDDRPKLGVRIHHDDEG